MEKKENAKKQTHMLGYKSPFNLQKENVIAYGLYPCMNENPMSLCMQKIRTCKESKYPCDQNPKRLPLTVWSRRLCLRRADEVSSPDGNYFC